MKLVTNSNATEYEIGSFGIDAAELGLAPGYWPETIETNLGNGMNFIKESRHRLPCGGCRYNQCVGSITLNVYND